MGYSVRLGDDLFAFSDRFIGETELEVDVTEMPGFGIQLRLHQIRELKAIEPWPALHVAWSTKHLDLERTLVPRERRFGAGGPTEEQLAHEKMVTEVIARLQANPAAATIAIDPGWTVEPVVPWSDAAGFPGEDVVGDGAFRTAADADPVVARRSTPGSFEKLLVWIASSPDRRLADTPGEVVLTREKVYARFGEVVRHIPRETLRSRKGPVDDDAVYVFGRRTRLILPHRESCPVRLALDEQLEGMPSS